MSELVFFLEEPSAEALLSVLVPPLVPRGLPLRFVVFEGKQDLEKQIVRRIRGYLVPDARFVVLRDQDAADCHVVKQALRQKCREAGRADTVIRIACRELESWYLADLPAVEKGLGVAKLGRLQDREKFRAPDSNPRALPGAEAPGARLSEDRRLARHRAPPGRQQPALD